MVICSPCTLRGNHLLGIAPAMCVGFPHGTEVYLSKKDSSHEERVTASGFFCTKESSLGKCCLQALWFHCWLAPALSALCPYSLSISWCWLFTSHLCTQNNLQTPWKGNPADENACAEGLLALCWDSEISDLRTEILGRMTASFLNLIRGVSSTLTDSWTPVLPVASQAKQTYLSSKCRIFCLLVSHHSLITSLHLCFVSFMVRAQPCRPAGDRVSLPPRGASSPTWSGAAPAKCLFWMPISAPSQGNPGTMSPDPSSEQQHLLSKMQRWNC